jgi:hypothetical protein
VGGDRGEDVACLREHPPRLVQDRHGLHRDPALAQAAPSIAAISTASAFIPPTARLSVIEPITSVSGTTPRTTAARSAVDV